MLGIVLMMTKIIRMKLKKINKNLKFKSHCYNPERS
jgi:hypothetical protein